MTRDQFLRREAIKKRVAEGVTLDIVAREFGVSRQRIGQIAGRVGRVIRAGGRRLPVVAWDEESLGFARTRWDAGLTAAEIAKEMGVTRNSIIGVAHRNGFTARPSPLKRAAA